MIKIILLLLPIILLGEYHIEASKRPKSAIDRLPFKKIADTKNIPQNPAYYAKQLKPLSRFEQERYDREYNRLYFKPWEKGFKIKEPKSNLLWIIPYIKRGKFYTYSKRLIKSKTKEAWIKNAQMDKLGSVSKRAITITHSNLRALPTNLSIYKNPNSITKGFPFDVLQDSAIYPNTPLYLSHYSKDKKWAYVQAGFVGGWIPTKDIALVDDKFIKKFKSGHYFITIKDNLKLVDDNGKRVSLLKLGTIFPIDSKGQYLLVARRGKRGEAVLKRVKIPSLKYVALKPLRFTPKNVAKIAKEFYGEPYGWGGKMMTRDCSATTRDFFGVFGIFLKRNSSQQAKEGKSVVSIKGLPKSKKKRVIIKYAKPFRSMLYVPGHITLYLGQYKGEPVIMHTYWGVRLNNWSKYTLCRTIISTTEPGKEIKNIREKSKLINTLQKIITF